MDDIEVIDTIQAYQIEDGDQIVIGDDHVSDVAILDDDGIMVKFSAFSHTTGDREYFELAAFSSIDVWTV